MIEIKNIHKSFGNNDILKGIDLTIQEGEVVAIIGPSGSGKTTFLRCLNYLEEAQQGTISMNNVTVDLANINKKEILALRRHTGMVFQNYNLFLNKTALENITEGLLVPRKKDKAEAESIAGKLLEMVGLAAFKDYYPTQLSGGQQQRIGIARALALEPELMLFDEPTSSLDPELVGEVLSIIKKVAESGSTMIIVTHEIGFAYDVADKIVFMEGGYIVEQGTPEEIIKYPKEERTKKFIQQTQLNAQSLVIEP